MPYTQRLFGISNGSNSELSFKRTFPNRISGFVAGVIVALLVQGAATAQLAVQRPSDVAGTGTNAWSYLILEGENYVSEVTDTAGFIKVYGDEAITSFLGNPVLATNTTASGKGALFAQTPNFGLHADKVTYQVQFATPGTYYLYMRFTMFDNAGNGNYLSEDSFFVPPDFDKDPQADWPLTDPANGRNGGYTEGCCGGAGFLHILDQGGGGTRTDKSGDTNYWEGNFHWNQLLSSQFLASGVSGEPGTPHKYEVTQAMVGRPLNFTVSYREAGVTPDLWLFSTHTNLMEYYSQTNLDDILVNKLTVQDPADKVGTGTNGWSYLILEGERYYSEVNSTPGTGFTQVYGDGAVTNSLGNPVLGTDTTASGKGALFAQSPNFGLHADKVSYQVQFATPGTYYLYMRFTMFDNAGGNGNYLSEDSFFVPPDFDKDPQTDWPLTDPANGRNGGYTEGCCGGSGFLHILNQGGGGTRTDQSTDTNYWEGQFHWNQLLSSQFLSSGVSGEPSTPHKYEVTPAMVGRPLKFTVSYREAGVTPDLWLFSTHTNLMEYYSQQNLDDVLINKIKLTVQDPGNVAGTGTNAWSYLLLEGEDFGVELNNAPGVGFTKVYGDGAVTNSLGNPVLGTDTTASGKGALFAQSPNFGLHADKVTYQVQFATPGTYYLYMRFTMFDNAGGNGNYLSEDSFFVPPDFDKDPQTDWPLTDPANGRNGGYTEGCCGGSGFLHILNQGGGGTRTDQSGDTNYWEGNFHWNQLLSSQFLSSGVSGEPSTPHKYEVTPAMVGRPLNFTVSYREAGVTPDLWLFSTHTNLMEFYSQDDLDQLLLYNNPGPPVTFSHSSTTLTLFWPVSAGDFVLESTSTFSPPNWTPVTTPIVVVGDQNSVEINVSSGNGYYRLKNP